MSRFCYTKDEFLLDGKAFQIRSGSIHYFRMPREYWYDRLLKLKECGFNCVETYLAWNLHEPQENVFRFDGDLDFIRFIQTAKDLGLYAIVRPGPFICAEWEAGGLPAWLLRYEDVRIRCNNAVFMKNSKKYLDTVLPMIRPYCIEEGGNVIMVQIENEYGSYGNDKSYLNGLYDIFRNNLPDCVFFTSDGTDIFRLNAGRIENCLSMSNFGSGVIPLMTGLKSNFPDQPAMCAEFWCGWFDHWHENHHRRSAESLEAEIDAIMKNKYNFNLYMFFGGTNFGFMNGANYNDGQYMPTVTSYDYDAPLNESGDRTEKYYAIRNVIKRYISVPDLTANDSEKRDYGKVHFTAGLTLTEALKYIGKEYTSPVTDNMEKFGVAYGYILYRTRLVATNVEKLLYLDDLHDRAVVMLDGKIIAVRERGVDESAVQLPETDKESELSVLVENMGRINFGYVMFDKKGVRAIRHGRQNLFGYNIVPLPMDNLDKIVFSESVEVPFGVPAFYRGELTADKVCDTFLRLDGFSRGFVTVNGFNIGRYDTNAGSQKTLYVPGTLLHTGVNEIIVFDSQATNALDAKSVSVAEI